MIARVLVWLVVGLACLIVVPPLCYGVLGGEPPALPPVGRLVPILEGQRLNVIEEGEGPPVVLVHGLPGTAYDWRNLTHGLARRGRHVYAYDRAGYGHSDPRPEEASDSPPRNAEELIALLDALGLEKATIVGWSYGGVTAMMAAQQAPERFERLVLIGTGGPDSADARPPEPPGLIRFLYSDPVLAWRSRVPPVGQGLIRLLSNTAFSGKQAPGWWLPGVAANFARAETLDTYRSEMFTLEGELEPAAIEVPTLLLHGDDDRLAPIAIAEYLDAVIPVSGLTVFEEGSHMLPVTQPGKVADAIVGFDL